MSSVSFSSFFIRVYVECKIDKMYEKRKPFTLQIGLMMFFFVVLLSLVLYIHGFFLYCNWTQKSFT